MSDWGYIVLAWALTVGVLVLFSLRVLVRGRRLSRSVPEDRRRWMS